MDTIKLSRVLRLRKLKLQKWSQCTLAVGIFVFLCVIRADKLLWESEECDFPEDTSNGNHKAIALSKKCFFRHDTDVDVFEFEDLTKMELTVAYRTTFMSYNATGSPRLKVEKDVNNTKKAHEIDEQINDIVKAYANKRVNSTTVRNRTVSNRTELYSEIPPDYDDLIKVVLNTRERCTDAGDYHAVIAVHSAAYHFENRAVFRWMYGDFAKTNPYRFKLVFFVGLVKNKTLQDRLVRENEEFGDTVQGNFIDAYINMTYKAIMVFNWLDTHCRGIKGLFRVDDDVFMNMRKVYPRWMFIQRTRGRKTLMCDRLYNDRVLRTGKWAVPRSLIPGDKYEFMRCPGLFAGITVDLIHEMNVQSRKVPFFWIDDVVMLGLVPNAIGNVFFYPFNKWMAGAKNANDFYACIRKFGQDCRYWLGITEIENFRKLYGYISGIIPLVKYEFPVTK